MPTKLHLLLISLLLAIRPITTITNLFSNSGFQQALGVPGWYSAYSGSVRLRYDPVRNTTAMDTLNSNTHEKVCYNISVQSGIPYQLGFDYFNDESTTRGLFKVTWNNLTLQHRAILDFDTHQLTSTVYLDQVTNILCMQGWGQAETTLIGILIDNIMLIPYQIRYVHFSAVEKRDQPNYVQLVSNFTVADVRELGILRDGIDVEIGDVEFRVDMVGVKQSGLLYVLVEIMDQYASTANTSITLPTHRNSQNQPTLYFPTSSPLPRLLYQPQPLCQILQQSRPYLRMLTKIYNICFRVVRVVAFAFLGLRYLTFYYVLLFLGFLDLHFFMGCARELLGEFVGEGVNWGVVGFFGGLAGFGRLGFGAENIPLTNTSLPTDTLQWAIPYSTANLSANLYLLVADDLLISLLNTLKIFLLDQLLSKKHPKMRTILSAIKNQKIFIQFLLTFSVVAFVCGVCWRYGWQLCDVYGKLNYAGIVGVVGLGGLAGVAAFLADWGRMGKEYRRAKAKVKGNAAMDQNQKKKRGYRNKILLNLTQSLTLIITPLLIGLNHITPTLLILLTLTILKLSLCIKAASVSGTFLSFISPASLLLQLLIIVSFLLGHMIDQIPTLSSNTELVWMAMLRYCSISLLFLYVGGGFIEMLGCVVGFFRGFGVLEIVCVVGHNRQEVDEIGGNQIKIQKVVEDVEGFNNKELVQSIQIVSDIRTINQLRDRISGHFSSTQSLQQISNPFIKSPKKETQQQKSAEQPKVKAKKESRDLRMTKVITMKHIEQAQTLMPDEKIKQRAKSASQSGQQTQNKSLVIKKPKQLSKQKGLHLIKKLQLPKPNKCDEEAGLSLFGKVVVSNFQKEQNFS